MTATTVKDETVRRETCTVKGSTEQLSATSTPQSCDTGLCQDAVREKAYLLWEAAGYPEGDGQDFWYQAEQELSSLQ